MSLLDDVSIVVTPNGYKAGELYAVIPVPTEGSEEIATPDFSSSTGWSFTNSGGSNGWIINAGRAICDASATTPYRNLNSTFSLVNGKSYRLIIDILQSSDNMKIVIGGTTLAETLPTGTNLNYEYFIPEAAHSGGGFTIYAGSSDLQEIDNVSVKEYTSADMDVTRATAATRVDEDGLVNYAEILGGEEVTNGDFATDLSGWTGQAGRGSYAWDNGKAKITNDDTSGYPNLSQSVTTVSGKVYKVNATVEIGTATLTEVRAYSGGVLGSQQLNTDGTIDFTFTAIGTSFTLHLYLFEAGNTGNYCFFDNISVKEVTRDNVPRIDYTGGGCPHILAEPQRTNQFVQSNNFNTSWTQTSVDVATDVITSPISGELADSVTATTATAQHRVLQTPASTGIGTFTMYIKQGELSRICIHFLGTNKAVGFDCSDNTTFAATGIASYPTRYAISDFGNGWSKLEMYDVGSTTRVDIYIANPTVGGNNAVWTGDGTSKIYFAAAQFELGSYATSYIPTSGSTVTRNQDIFTRDGIGSLINSTEGVLFIEMAALSDDLTFRVMSISDGTNNNTIKVGYRNNTNAIYVEVRSSSVGQVFWIYTATDITDFHKIAVKYKVNDFSLWIDGTNVLNDTNGNTPIGLSKLSFDRGDSFTSLFAKVKQLQVYDTALTDTQLAALTS